MKAIGDAVDLALKSRADWIFPASDEIRGRTQRTVRAQTQ
jgi:hypothetical protein